MNKLFSSALTRALLGAAGCLLAVTASAAQTLEPLSVRLDWTPWGVHAAFHLAQQKGWYRDAGLDVHLEDGNGSVTTVQIVGSGDSFDVGNASLASMMIARDKGLPVKAVAVFARKSDIGLLVPTDSAIKGPADLKGKKVVYTAGSLEAPFINGFLAAGGLKRSDLDLLSVDAASKITTYAVGRADAVISTIPFVIASVAKARPSRAIAFADYGMKMPSFGLFANEDKLKSKRSAISRFASVTARTWEYIYAGHQDEAVDAIIAQRPQARLDRTVLRAQIDALHEYFGKPEPGYRLGVPVPSDWVQAVKTLSSAGMIGTKRPASDYYVTDMVHPEKYDAMVAK